MRGTFILGIVGAACFVLAEGCSESAQPAASGEADGGVDPNGNPSASSSSSGAPSDGGSNPQGDPDAEPPGPPAVRYAGRFDTRDTTGPRVGWSGARVVVRFTGTTLTAKIAEKNLDLGPSYYDVTIDGTAQPSPFVPTDGTADHVIAKDLGPGVHVVELWRRTEGTVGLTQFLGFDIGGGGKLLAPPLESSRRIEFFGDSASNGYGIECANANENFSGATQNEHKSYSALVAKALSAEHYNISFSGKGVSRNYDDADTDMMSSIYLRALPEDPASTWNFGSWTPDLVFVALGANDWDDAGINRPPPDQATFKAKYHELVTLIRAKNPNAQIVCSVAASLNDDYPPGYNALTNMRTILQAVVAERKSTPYNDAKVSYYEFPRANSSSATVAGAPDLTGCNYHLNAAFSQTIATDVVAKIKTITGW